MFPLEIWEKEIGKMYGQDKSMKDMTYKELCVYRKELCKNIQIETAKAIFEDMKGICAEDCCELCDNANQDNYYPEKCLTYLKLKKKWGVE